MTRPPAGTVHLSIRVTPELWARMQQVMRDEAETEPPMPAEQFRQAHESSKRMLAQFLEEQQAIIAQFE